MDRVPAALADVIEPLREADEYRRFQLQRQRGVYNLLTGFPGLFFVLAFGNIHLLAAAFGFPLFLVACAPQMFLPLIRRVRPDWESPLLNSSLLEKALEKQFWLQAPTFLAFSWFPFFVGLALALAGTSLASIALATLAALILVGGSAALARQAWKTGDRLLAVLSLTIALPAPLILAWPEPFLNAAWLIGLLIVAPPILAGIYRLFAPRSWLVG